MNVLGLISQLIGIETLRLTEGTHHHEGTSNDPPMTPIERQMQVIATSIQDLARETSRQNQELWQAIRKWPPTPHDDNQCPPRGRTGRTTKKLTAVK